MHCKVKGLFIQSEWNVHILEIYLIILKLNFFSHTHRLYRQCDSKMTEKKTPPLPTVFCEEVFDENSLPSEDGL